MKRQSDVKFEIRDWAGNLMFDGQEFTNFDNAEEFLSEFLNNKYDTDRQEYEIIPAWL